MDDQNILIRATPNFLNLKNFTFEGVRSATFGILKKENGTSTLIHYESTNKKWQRFYSNANETKMCHIVKSSSERAQNVESFTVIWNMLIPDSEESKFLNERRIELDHCNGVTICSHVRNNLLLCATFTGAQHDDNFVATLLKNKSLLLRSTFNSK